MLDNFDTQMADYMTDIDMQVHAFSSDPWLHDEAKMEEDAPGLKLENYIHAKQDGHDQGDLTIEIDMEEHNSAEYDMVDDEQLHQPPEILDVEVYDASLAHSPAMGSFDSVLPAESSFSTVVVPPTEPQEADVTTVPESTLSEELIPASVASPALQISEEPVAESVPDSHQDASHTDDTSNTNFSPHESVIHPIEPIESASSEEPTVHFDPEYASSAGGTGGEPAKERSQEEALERPAHIDPQAQLVEGLLSTPDEGPPSEADALETTHASGLNVESTSSGDPHEISEGVYIDPPPAVLFTISFDDHEYQFSLFNEPAEWGEFSTNHHADAHRTLLHHLPTMYYESLYSLFEALRQDEFIHSTFHLPEVELVLQAVDLGLTISEDNVYSRDVSLHDLNMLHDGSGIGGPLRAKLYASNSRFIIQYQQLQEHVSRLPLGHQSRGISLGGPTETHGNQPSHLGHISDHQEVPTEAPEPETHSTKPSEHGDRQTEESEEPAETETHFPSDQNFQSEPAIDAPEREDETRVSPTVEKEESRDSRTDEEESPTDSYPTAADNDHDSESTYAEEDTAVVGLDVLEAEVIGQNQDEEEHGEEASASVYDEFREGDEAELENEPLEDSFHDPQEDDGSQTIDEADVADEQGDEISHEYSEYAEPEAESEPLPDQFQAHPQDVDDEHDQSDDVKKFDQPSEKADGQEYDEEEPLPELPTDPISFDEDSWELKEFKEFDESWNDGDGKNERSLSNHSSVTLSSRGSKRTYDEYESGGEDYDEEQQWELPESPDSKRSRTE